MPGDLRAHLPTAVHPLRRLAALLAPGGPLAPLPTTSGAWDGVLAAAGRHRLTPALWSALRGAGAIGDVPRPVMDFAEGDRLPVEVALARSHRTNADHVADLSGQGRTILDALSAAGVRAIPLKGLDAVWSGRYPDPAARTMTDIDLLVDPDRIDRAARELVDLGYRSVPAPSPSAHQLDPLVHPGRGGSVELHRALTVRRWSGILDPTAVLDRSGPAGVATRTDSALHLLAHATLHDEGHALWRLPLRALHETALLLHGPEEVDWDEVVGAFDRVGQRAAALAHLAVTAELFGVGPPVPVGGWRGPVRTAATVLLDGRADLARPLEQVLWAPRALGAGRMRELYGPDRPIAAARTLHVARGVARRLRGGG